jgi:hypothetical protein
VPSGVGVCSGAIVPVALGASAPSAVPLVLDFGAPAFLAVDFSAVDFLAAGSSTIGARRIPFESAKRRTRSAIGSSMLEE